MFNRLKQIPKFKPGQVFRQVIPGERVERVIFLDVETTGLNPTNDRMIELGWIECLYSQDNLELLEVVDVKSYLEDPGWPLPENIKELTGIDDEMLAGQHFPDEEIEKVFTRVGDGSLPEPMVVIAHYTPFDRAFFNHRFPKLEAEDKIIWGDSCTGVRWYSRFGQSSRKLGELCKSYGFCYSAHRAVNDCAAVLQLMLTERDAFSESILNTERRYVYVHLPAREYGSYYLSMIQNCPARLKEHALRHTWGKVVPISDLGEAVEQICSYIPVEGVEVELLERNEQFDLPFWTRNLRDLSHRQDGGE